MSGTPGGTTVLDIIEKRLIPNEEAKRARGEVFTPLHIVHELLYGVRKEPLANGVVEPWGVDPNGKLFDDPAERIGGIPLEVWKNPESKWLDPANGIGNFPYIAFQMLDHQLRDVFKETVVRRKHIVEKMLFMIEIDKGNVNTSFKIFDQLAPGAAPNICCADTLKLKDTDLTKEFGTAKFDVVMGNPPFQKPQGMVKKTGSYGGNTLWDEFVRIFLNRLSPNGYLLFVTPPMWRKPDAALWRPISTENRLRYLRILNKKASEKEFKVSQRIDIYSIQYSNDGNDSVVVDEKNRLHSIDTTTWAFLPNYAYDDISKIMTTKETGINVIFNSFYDSRKPYVSKEKDGLFIYPVVHGITQKGLSLIYTNDNTKGHFGVPKVILNFNEQQYPVNDFDGTYGMSQISFGIPISSKEEGDLIVRAMNTERFKEIIKATKWGAFQTEYKMFKYFKPDFYKEFLPKEGAARRRTRRNKKAGTRRHLL